MTDRVERKLDSTRKLLLSVAGWLTVAAAVLFGLVDAAKSRAQTSTDNKTQSIADTWQGTLHAGQDLRTVVKISKADDGGYKAVFFSIDQGGGRRNV
jgi:phosphodiesterase/alkaline phosphatase D-like protein